MMYVLLEFYFNIHVEEGQLADNLAIGVKTCATVQLFHFARVAS